MVRVMCIFYAVFCTLYKTKKKHYCSHYCSTIVVKFCRMNLFAAYLLALIGPEWTSITSSAALPINQLDEPLPPTKPKPSNNTVNSESGNHGICNANITKSGIAGETFLWNDGFNVHPDPKFSRAEYDIINAALHELSEILCIKVKIWPQMSRPIGDYAFIKRGARDTGCNAVVGKQGGKQIINLDFDGCIVNEVVLHETIHALGYFHEQSRPDRDKYVTILYDNITPDYRFAFDKYNDTLTYGVPYDQTSIMHYGAKYFSDNGKDTIKAKNGQPLGSTGKLTARDIQKLKAMYNCPS